MSEQSAVSREDERPARSPNRRLNRFARYRWAIALATALGLIVCLELLSYGVIIAKGHQNRRGKYPYNRMISGYTVFQNVPHYDMGSSTIRESPDDPAVVLDQFGFISGSALTDKKPANSVRIFVTGGSAAFGAGQNSAFYGVHPYGDGVQSFPNSIAGQLQKYLSRQDPSTNYQVINAAAYARQLHQSTILYMQTISQLSPDIVVSIDGWNDVASMISSTPYRDAEKLLPALVDLQSQSDSWLRRSNTVYVLSTALDKYRVTKERSRAASAEREIPQLSVDEYRRRRSDLIASSRRFEQLLQHHVAALQADDTRLVFVLQPMLPRTATNKPFSKIEQQLLRQSQSLIGVDSGHVVKYFLDDHLSDRCRQLVESAGETYIDANREITKLDRELEFYTDYCHLTADGNRVLAELIGDRILQVAKSIRMSDND